MATTGILHDSQDLHPQQKKKENKNTEKNTGCMAGFFNLRRHILPASGKQFYHKRLPPSPGVPPGAGADFSSEAEPSSRTPSLSADLLKLPPQAQPEPKPSPSPSKPPPPPEKTPLHLSSPWKFAREAPRFSLDSRFVIDAKGGLHPRDIRTKSQPNLSGCGDENDNQRRSPSVVARLMGLEHPLPGDDGGTGAEPPERKIALQRSASESRSRDLIQYPPLDSNSSFMSSSPAVRGFDNVDPEITHKLSTTAAKMNVIRQAAEDDARAGVAVKKQRARERRPLPQQRKSYYDTSDFFPEPKPTSASSIHGDIVDRRLKATGIDRPPKDLDTLKQILDAVHLKGLLHSKPPSEDLLLDGRTNFVYYRGESPIVGRRTPKESPASSAPKMENRQNLSLQGGTLSSRSPRRERTKGNRRENRTPIPAALTVETRRREGESDAAVVAEQRGGSPVRSPRRLGHTTTLSPRSPRSRRPTAQIYRSKRSTVRTEDESSSVSESSYSTCSQPDTERLKMIEEYSNNAAGRSLLERCDRLLQSIAEMTATSSSSTTPSARDTTVKYSITTAGSATELQPSPVSVLDSSFHKDEEEEDDSPSPVIMRRTVDFKEVDQVAVELDDEELSSPSSTVVQFNDSESSDLAYVSEILRAHNYLHRDEAAVFQLLEKQQLLKGRDASKSSRVQRRLIFDTVNEILDRSQPPERRSFRSRKPSLSYVWSELRSIREMGPKDDLLGTISEVLKRDLARDSITGWGDCPVEMSDTVLDVERMIFKDLIGETLRDFATLAGKNVPAVALAPRRKLVF